MQAHVESMSTPKDGHSDVEYEDAFATLTYLDAQTASIRCRCAISDGASDSWYSGMWARQLAHAAISGKRGSFLNPLGQLQQKWLEHTEGHALSWVAVEKAAAGAFAAVLGLDLFTTAGGPPGVWEAVAIGDCCLFQMRGADLVSSFPYKKSNEFNNRPVLLGSQTQSDEAADMARRERGEWVVGDVFLLMTDSLAHWFLDQKEKGISSPHEVLRALVGAPGLPTRFAAWVDEERREKRLRNDDTTLVWVELV